MPIFFQVTSAALHATEDSLLEESTEKLLLGLAFAPDENIFSAPQEVRWFAWLRARSKPEIEAGETIGQLTFREVGRGHSAWIEVEISTKLFDKLLAAANGGRHIESIEVSSRDFESVAESAIAKDACFNVEGIEVVIRLQSKIERDA